MADQPLTPPRIYLIRMVVFLVLAGFVAFILYRQIWEAFQANPGLNALIMGVMVIGIVLAIRQVWRLRPEVRWVNTLQRTEEGLVAPTPPVLLAPLAALLGNRPDQSGFSVAATRSVLDSIGARLDESREILRYLAGLLVFLGLLGTFWGLIDTVGSVGRIIGSLRTGQDSAVLFDELKNSLAGPLQGMGLAFSASLFGLAGSLVLGFLDLQAGQAQNRFYTELEDWLATSTTDAPVEASLRAGTTPDLTLALNRLSAAVNEGGGGRAATQAMANLAEGVQGLVQHMRAEQQMIRDWVEAQAAREKELKQVLDRLSRERLP
ncbi:MotA/TolQ/ExbB proton channel family protein [Microvirga arabica]|uniref:MotA/TolQ/ExbB proton channel family protein n=1 Tax=Microvirga arabica TaxID=1128671 RepID=A0ABV6YA96_9HYPH|nr:MotA/TolQ/ExbB proton channel family protein [Microvirga arabica]MBM1172859.1 MotA/TolQ/ExbB proton channel family protein [Microvirga arabica]